MDPMGIDPCCDPIRRQHGGRDDSPSRQSGVFLSARWPAEDGASVERTVPWSTQARTCCSSFQIPSGKRLHNYGKSPFFMGKSTISMAIFNSFLYVYQRVSVLIRTVPLIVNWLGKTSQRTGTSKMGWSSKKVVPRTRTAKLSWCKLLAYILINCLYALSKSISWTVNYI